MIWKDIRLHFKNLREDRQLNIILPEDAKEIWVPVVDFLNAEGNQNSEVDLHSKVTIKRLGGKVEDNVELSKEGETLLYALVWLLCSALLVWFARFIFSGSLPVFKI